MRSWTTGAASCLILVAASLTARASSCPDPRERTAVIGGSVIRGHIALKRGPLILARVRLYSAGTLRWSGATDQDSSFLIEHLTGGSYELSVAGWGKAKVEIRPGFERLGNGQVWSYDLLLLDNGCIAAGQSTD
jgi:hypothetical protein